MEEFNSKKKGMDMLQKEENLPDYVNRVKLTATGKFRKQFMKQVADYVGARNYKRLACERKWVQGSQVDTHQSQDCGIEKKVSTHTHTHT